jgi:hypothetical protein
MLVDPVFDRGAVEPLNVDALERADQVSQFCASDV